MRYFTQKSIQQNILNSENLLILTGTILAIIINFISIKIDMKYLVIGFIAIFLLTLGFIRYKYKFLVFIFLSSCILPDIQNIGVDIVDGIKISIVDIELAIILIYMYFSKKIIYRVPKKANKIFIAMLSIICIYSIIGFVQNGSQSIRIVRNISYIYFTFIIIYNFLFTDKTFNKCMLKKTYIYFFMFCLIIIIYKFSNIVIESREFKIYRINESLISSLFVGSLYYFILFKEDLKKKILNFIFIFILLIGIIIQQERTMIIAIFLSIFITSIYSVFNKLKIKKQIKILIYFLILFLIITIISIFMYNNNLMFKGLVDNYITYRIGVIFNDNKFVLDSSLSTRGNQVQVILGEIFSNLKFLIFGKGLGAFYMPNVFIVDSCWLWTFLNMGILGLFLILNLFISIMIKINKITYKEVKICLFSYFLTTFIMSIATPNFIWRIDDAVNMGLIIAITQIISKNIENNN